MLGRPYGAYYVRPMREWTAPEDEAAANRPSAMTLPEHPLLPWRDFSLEYPPGMLVFALLPALLTADKDLFHFLFCLEMELALTFSVWLVVRAGENFAPGRGRDILGLAIACVAGLGIIAVRRYDGAVALTVAAALAAFAARRGDAAGLALAAGILVKGVPLILAPLGLADCAARRAWGELARAVAAAAAVLLASAGAYLWLAGPHAVDAFAYHGGRPLQIESSYGALLIAARIFDPEIVTRVFSFGSDNIVSPWEPALRQIASLLPLLALLGLYVWSWRALRRAPDDKARLRIFFAAVSAALVAFMTLGKIFSPQYMLWLLPSGLLVGALGSKLNRQLLVFACILTQIEYPFAYTVLAGDLDPRLGLLVLMRGGVLLWWAGLALAEATAPAGAAARESLVEPAPALAGRA
jgi:hypothetical protein